MRAVAVACTVEWTGCPWVSEQVMFALGAIVAQDIGLNSGFLANHYLVSVLFRFFFPPARPFSHCGRVARVRSGIYFYFPGLQPVQH